ncbi:C3a anaphylatoxin chemotactic receptor-like [Engystomops pustulosus]|uniref:C3a anaphylatoxin chemotactic receptor-like n=1 Tax=Engystomops pustulosus TaxID=76066 RepID=UPI003AFA4A7C
MENGLVIWIAGFRMKKTISAVWFLHLAIADCLCCASITLRVIWKAELIKSSKYIYKTLMTISLIIPMSASVLLLTAMSVDRWISVMWPFWAKVHRTVVIWMLCLVVTGLVCYFSLFYDSRANIQLIETSLLIRLVVLFVIPFLLIFTSYVTIFFKLRKSKRPQRSQRPYRIITAVILCFFICWSPLHVWPLIPMDGRDALQLEIEYTIIFFLTYLNSCINPIIYVFMDQDFRHGFLRSIPFKVEIALSEPPDDTSR